MNKIVLNEKQKAVLKKQIDGEYSPFFSANEEQLLLNEVIDMANDLMDELEAYDEAGDDLMIWFWEQYQNQEQE